MRLKFFTCILALAITLPPVLSAQVVVEQTLLGKIGDACVSLAQHLVTGKKSTVEYWENKFGRKLEEGEVLTTQRFGNNTFIFRYNGQHITWEYYRITGRGYFSTSAYYPKKFFNIDFFKDKKVLDVGCGQGKLVEDLRRQLTKINSKPDIHGVDISLNHSTTGKDYFHQADIRKTSFKDNEYDLVFSTWSIFSYEQHSDPVFITHALKEVKRILKPGGRFILSPVDPVIFNQYANEVGGLKVVESGRQRRIQPDPATLLTIGNYVVIEKI